MIERDRKIHAEYLPNLEDNDQGVYILSATADSGLPVAFSVDQASIATVQGNKLTLKAGGTAKVTATQGGDITYKPADSVIQTLTVQDDTLKPPINYIQSKSLW